ncbi:carboxypeptidase A1-like [Epargyreus clarus]|uniref:carboxypeptidase A1-like n=1 Tax=Epargyreus clarus TaxID=520877 RepID=UPI003C2ADDA9
MSYKVLLKDVQEKIDKEVLMKNETGRRAGKLSWTSYPNLKDIYAFLADVASSGKGCSLSVVGQTAHKTDIKMIKLSNGNPSNPAILIDGGMHAREWTSVVSVLYFIDAIARNYSKQPPFITNNDWYIIPVLNPDGYIFSMTKDRLWRKNRRYFSGPCDGVDINRNFGYSWCQKGGSNSICSANYCGVEPFSEAESKVIKDLVSARHFLAYISVRSYGKKILFPWAMTPTPTPDIREHIRVSNSVASAMYAVDKHTFKTGSINRAGRENGAGMAVDWLYSQGVVHSYMLETRGEGIGAYFLEPKQIEIAVKEVYAGLVEFARIM